MKIGNNDVPVNPPAKNSHKCSLISNFYRPQLNVSWIVNHLNIKILTEMWLPVDPLKAGGLLY